MRHCNRCNQLISFVETPRGKMIPVNYAESAFLLDDRGPDYAMLQDGTFARGTAVGDAHEGGYVLAYVSHIGQCGGRS